LSVDDTVIAARPDPLTTSNLSWKFRMFGSVSMSDPTFERDTIRSMEDSSRLIDTLLALDERIRTVAVLLDGRLESCAREGLEGEGSDESGRYDELLVNPTVLDLVQRRGNIDRGGARYIVIRYGHFWHLAMACRGGHVSIGIDLGGDPLEIAAAAADALLAHGR
jgi:hypothetical protein